MKVVEAAFETYRETHGGVRDWHFLYLERQDGLIFGFTSGDKTPAPIDGVTYIPGFRPFAVQTTADMRATNTQSEGGFSADAVTEEDIAAGKWDRAYWEYFRAKWDDLSIGIEKINSGYLGEVTRGRTQFVADLNGLFELLNQQFGRVIQAPCDDDLGGPRCKVRLDPPVWQALTAYTVRPPAEAALGSVVKPSVPNDRHFKCTTAGTSGASEPAWNTTGTTSDGSVTWTAFQALTVYGSITSITNPRLSFRDSGRSEADQFFAKITFTSGLNDGVSREIKSYSGSGNITLQLPLPFDVQVGDDYEMIARCGKSLSHCRDDFDNVNNHQGFPHVTGNDYLTSGKVAEEV